MVEGKVINIYGQLSFAVVLHGKNLLNYQLINGFNGNIFLIKYTKEGEKPP
ncbi:hypothetical protein P378_00350 [Desulforamulus profundi]|uniref:Uncharacterized protein n=1 Tax=Desulforamulus profundi TaxID=1383067 RepID=A0A2C6LMV0_9FIRM|nr:hypothetical protein P378_03740 [Desulforamulus profundi]PHJ39940.1 hypothetical protein P378_00350 [Desulforamulus profundi]